MKNLLGSVTELPWNKECNLGRRRIKRAWTPSPGKMLLYFKLQNATIVDISHGTSLKFKCINPQAEQAKVAEFLYLSELGENLLERSSALRYVSKFLTLQCCSLCSKAFCCPRFAPRESHALATLLLISLFSLLWQLQSVATLRLLKAVQGWWKIEHTRGLAESCNSSQDMFTLVLIQD